MRALLHRRGRGCAILLVLFLATTSAVALQEDHSHMDHSGMDHAKMDHSGMAMPSGAKPAPAKSRKHARHARRTRAHDMHMGAELAPAAPGATHNGHAMTGMAHGAMMGFLGPYPMTREGSGTSWVPDATPHEGLHQQLAE